MDEEPRAGRCWYCGSDSLRSDDPSEHIIPEAMGGKLKTDRVCRDCNGRAGKTIDGPFLRDPLIAMARALHSPGGDRMRPSMEGSLGDGTPVDLKTGGGPWRARVRGGIERNGDEILIRASDREEYEKLLARARLKIEAEGRHFEEPGEPEVIEDSGEVVVRTKVEGVVWLRMGAKVALGCLSKVLDEDWLDTADALKYRGWLWDEEPKNEDGTTALGFPVRPNDFELPILAPPEHLLYFAPAGVGRVTLSIVYFGSLFVRAQVEIGERPAPRIAWRTGPGAAPTETSFDTLLAEMAVSAVGEGA